jgi:hypothetical protein
MEKLLTYIISDSVAPTITVAIKLHLISQFLELISIIILADSAADASAAMTGHRRHFVPWYYVAKFFFDQLLALCTSDTGSFSGMVDFSARPGAWISPCLAWPALPTLAYVLSGFFWSIYP